MSAPVSARGPYSPTDRAASATRSPDQRIRRARGTPAGEEMPRAGGSSPARDHAAFRPSGYFFVVSAGAPSAGAIRRRSISFFNTSLLSTLNSTRRFCALPSGVLLVAIGFDDP